MSKIKYAVWFHGTEDECEGICYSGREPYIVDEKHLAEEHKNWMENCHGGMDKCKFSVCMIIVDDIS